jgi:antitoxin HicB
VTLLRGGETYGAAAGLCQETAEDAGAGLETRAQQGILQECEEQAIKPILADHIKAAMKKDRLTKAAMTIHMRTSRRALGRLLDPTNTSVTVHTLQRAAVAIGHQLQLEII